MNATKIEWVRNPDGSQGYSSNPLTGCLNHVNGMCKGGNFPCYAWRLAHGRLKSVYLANKNLAPIGERFTIPPAGMYERAKLDPFYPRFWPERLEELHDRNRAMLGRSSLPKERGIFICDMGELFGDWVPEEWTREVLSAIELNEGHDRFYLLTKQPQNLPKWNPWPKNCWVGATATNETMALRSIACLNIVDARVRFLSLEPLLGPMENLCLDRIEWVILGAMTGPGAWPPDPSWVEGIIDQADRAGVPVFLKRNLQWSSVREEFPNRSHEG